MDTSPRPGLKRYQEEKIKKKEEIKPNPIQMANPELIWVSEKEETDEEGCLSIPGIMGDVTRPSSCKVKYLDRNGESKKLLAKGLLARCVQHEIDHVNGILFIDHMSKTKKDIILRKIKKQQKEKKQTT
jgi:peptide deformylase